MGAVFDTCCKSSKSAKKEMNPEDMKKAMRQIDELINGKSDFRDVITEFKFTNLF